MVGALLGLGLYGKENDALFASPIVQFVSILVVSVFTFGILYVYARYKGIKLSYFGVDRPTFMHVGSALIGLFVYLALYLTIVVIVAAVVPGFDSGQEQDLGVSTSQSGLNLALVFVSLVILPPLVEEFVMRGFLFSGLRPYLSFIQTTIIISILFGAAHLPGAKEGLLWVGALDTFILSVVLCYLREKSGSLWPSVALHGLKNGMAFTLVFVFPNVIG